MRKWRAVRGIEEVVARAWPAADDLAVWAQEVRLAAEVRMGVDHDDVRVWDDPAYAAALDRYSEFRAALERIQEVLERLKAGGDRPPERRSE